LIALSIWVYPGSFDPVTNGHFDIISRSTKLCDKLIVAILKNNSKVSTFDFDERIDLLRKVLKDIPNVEIQIFEGLLANFVDEVGASAIIKGLRAVSDYEYELQMALLNKQLSPDVETIFMTANMEYSYLSSSIVKEVARYGGDVSGLVPDCIIEDITKKFSK